MPIINAFCAARNASLELDLKAPQGQHREITPEWNQMSSNTEIPQSEKLFHTKMTGIYFTIIPLLEIETILAQPCDEDGNFLPPGSPPPPWEPHTTSANPWEPFKNWWSFNFAYQEFVVCKNSEAKIHEGLDILLATMSCAAGEKTTPPWTSIKNIYDTIDSIMEGALSGSRQHSSTMGHSPETPHSGCLKNIP